MDTLLIILIGLIILVIIAVVGIIAFFMGKKFSTDGKIVITQEELSRFVTKEREDAIKRSRAVVGGLFSEQLAAYLPDFKYSPNDVRFLGKPIDFVVFKGMNEKEISEIIFVEVKSGNSRLSPIEKNLKEVIKAGKVSWEEYKIPKDITDIPEEEIYKRMEKKDKKPQFDVPEEYE